MYTNKYGEMTDGTVWGSISDVQIDLDKKRKYDLGVSLI